MNPINSLLERIAAEKKIEILYACETGSRAWGFPSPDSDYDVRFIYRHKPEWYLSLNEHKDTIEVMEGELDVTGWDIRKCLRMLKKSNVALIERFQSPIEYCSAPGFKKEFSYLIDNYYSPMAVFYHHYSLAKRYREEITGGKEMKLKSFFYLMRSLLSCNWTIEDDTVLPMEIEGLMRYLGNAAIKEGLRELIALKATKDESYRCVPGEEYLKWIDAMFVYLETEQYAPDANDRDMTMLNDYFLKMMYGKADHR